MIHCSTIMWNEIIERRDKTITCILPYVLNGPIHLILFEIFTMSVQVDISHNYSMLQGLLQICKVYWGHNSVRISGLVYPSDHLILQYFFRSNSIVKSIWELFPPRIIFPECACLKVHTAHTCTSYSPWSYHNMIYFQELILCYVLNYPNT